MKSLTLAVILTIVSAEAGQVYINPRAYQQQQQLYVSQPQPNPQLYTAPQTFQQPQVYIQQPQSQQTFKSQQNFGSQHQNTYRTNANNLQGQARLSQGNDAEKNARIVSYEAENNGQTYMYTYETENGIRAQEAGSIQGKAKHAEGGYSYTGDDGQVYTVTYTADENGFRPQGSHLPTPPPMPEAIARSVEQNLQDEANGVVDDGQYTEEQHQQGGQNQQQYQQQPQPKIRQQTQQAPQLQYTPQQAPQLQYTYEQPPPLRQHSDQQQQYQYQPQQYQVVNQYPQYQDDQIDQQQLVQVTPAPYQQQIMRVVTPPAFQQIYQVGPTQEYA